MSAKKWNLKVNFKWKIMNKSSSEWWLKECAVFRSIYFLLKDLRSHCAIWCFMWIEEVWCSCNMVHPRYCVWSLEAPTSSPSLSFPPVHQSSINFRVYELHTANTIMSRILQTSRLVAPQGFIHHLWRVNYCLFGLIFCGWDGFLQ